MLLVYVLNLDGSVRLLLTKLPSISGWRTLMGTIREWLHGYVSPST